MENFDALSSLMKKMPASVFLVPSKDEFDGDSHRDGQAHTFSYIQYIHKYIHRLLFTSSHEISVRIIRNLTRRMAVCGPSRAGRAVTRATSARR